MILTIHLYSDLFGMILGLPPVWELNDIYSLSGLSETFSIWIDILQPTAIIQAGTFFGSLRCRSAPPQLDKAKQGSSPFPLPKRIPNKGKTRAQSFLLRRSPFEADILSFSSCKVLI